MSLSLAGSALLFPTENLVNGMIAQDPRAAESIARFHGKRVEVRTPHTGLNLLFDGGGIRLRALDAETSGERADVRIRGTALQLFRLLTDRGRPLADREIRVEGDAEFLLDLQRALREIDIRWEDCMGPIAGDVLTGGLCRAVTEAGSLARQAGGNIKRNLANYVQYEAGVMPAPEEMEPFLARVDDLRLRLDRLQARIENLCRDAPCAAR